MSHPKSVQCQRSTIIYRVRKRTHSRLGGQQRLWELSFLNHAEGTLETAILACCRRQDFICCHTFGFFSIVNIKQQEQTILKFSRRRRFTPVYDSLSCKDCKHCFALVDFGLIRLTKEFWIVAGGSTSRKWRSSIHPYPALPSLFDVPIHITPPVKTRWDLLCILLEPITSIRTLLYSRRNNVRLCTNG